MVAAGRGRDILCLARQQENSFVDGHSFWLPLEFDAEATIEMRYEIRFDHISDVRDDLDWPTARQLCRQHPLARLQKLTSGKQQALASPVHTSSSLLSRSTRQDTDLASHA